MALFKESHPNDTTDEVLYANRGDRVHLPGNFKAKPSPKTKLTEFCVRYIKNHTDWNLNDHDAEKQADVMYTNTFIMVKEFVATFLASKHNTGFRLSQLGDKDISLYAAMLDWRVKKVFESFGNQRGERAVVPLHLLSESWGTKTMIAYRLRNIGERTPKKSSDVSEVS